MCRVAAAIMQWNDLPTQIQRGLRRNEAAIILAPELNVRFGVILLALGSR
jgi:hypothetical protein